jgi:GNAT superfamily N-acetyltransferase
MIEDLFTLQSSQRRGIATAMIAAFTDHLRAAGCHTISSVRSPPSDPSTSTLVGLSSGDARPRLGAQSAQQGLKSSVRAPP